MGVLASLCVRFSLLILAGASSREAAASLGVTGVNSVVLLLSCATRVSSLAHSDSAEYWIGTISDQHRK